MTDLAPAPNPAIETGFLVNQAVLFDRRDGRVHELNPSASAVWLLIDGELDLDGIATELHELLGVERAVIRGDLDGVISDFARRGLLAGTEPVDDHADHHHDHPSVEHSGPTVLPAPPEP
ncbi:MAG: PqqD family protein [Desertimonas sp.]